MNSILPVASTTAFERIHDLTAEVRCDVPVPLRALVRPGEIDAAHLPFLAWGLSTDLWRDDWPIEVRRAVAAEWFDLHRYKGTQYGIRRHIEIAGGALLKVVAPPLAAFPGPTITREVRQSWLDRMPQMRIYPFVERGIDQRGRFTGPREKAFAGNFFPRDHRAGQRYRRFAKLYEPRDGSMTDLSYTVQVTTTFLGSAVDFEQIVLPRKAGAAFYAGQIPKVKTFLGPAGVPERMFRFQIDRPYEFSRSQSQDRTYEPGLDAIQVYPEHVFESGIARPRQFFAGRSLAGRSALPSTAWQRIYERVYLNDPARMIPIRRGTMFAGRARLGIPAYTAELTVDVSARRSRRHFFAGRHLFRLVSAAPDRSRLERVRQAVLISKALRDKILLRTATHRPVRFGDLWRADGLRFGGMIRDI